MHEIENRRRPPVAPISNGDLPEHRQKQVEAGLATYQAVLAERDQLDRQLREAIAKIGSLEKQLDAIQGIVNLMESTIKTYQIQRDEATIRSTRLQTTLNNVATLLANEAYDEQRDGDGLGHETQP